jgi:hypothetical protein
MNNALHSAAFHEAGHVVGARHFGQKITAVEIREDGGGKTDTKGPVDHLSRIDRLAIAYAGLASQTIFKCHAHQNATTGDHVAIIKLVEELTDEESLAMRNAGYLLATRIVKENALEVEQIVGVLIDKRRIGAWPYRGA